MEGGDSECTGSQKEGEDAAEQNDIYWETSVSPGGRGQDWAKPHLEVVGVGGCPDGGGELAQLELRAWQPHPPQALPLLMVH